MTDDELLEKLVNDLEARKRLDAIEAAAWRNQKADELRKERDAHAERIGVSENDIAVAQDYNNRLKDLAADFEKLKKANSKRHIEIDADIISGKAHHVWIDAKEEKLFNQAVKHWDREVEDAELYKRLPDIATQNRFREQYGENVYRELTNHTNREIDRKGAEKQRMEAEKAERIKLFQEQEEQRKLTESRQVKKDEQQKSGYTITTDTRKREPFDPNIERLKAQQKIDRSAIERLKQKQINPVERTSPVFDKLAQEGRYNKKAIEEKENSDTLSRIQQDIQRAREKAIANPVEVTEDSYDAMIRRIRERRERDKGYGW